MLRDNLLQAVKHTSIYSISWIANGIAGVCLLPVYSRYLSRAEYGALDLVGQNNVILKIVFAACFTYSLGRLYHDASNEEEKNKIISSGATSAIVAGIIAGACLLLFNSQVSQLLLGSIEFSPLFIAGGLVLTMDIAFTGLTYEFLVKKKSTRFVAVNLARLLIAITGNLVCLIWFELGAISMLIGNALGILLANTCMAFPHFRKYGFLIDAHTLKRMIEFGSPMIVAGILATLLHSSDRLMLRPLQDLEQVGLFMMGLRFPNMLNAILVTSFGTIWSGSLMFTMAKQPDADVQIGRFATYLLAFFLSAQTILGIFSASLLEILAAPKFAASIPVAPIACLGFSFHAFYLFLVSKAFTHNNPKRMILCYVAPLIAKVALTIFFVPIYGFMGSACVLTSGYLLFTVTCYLVFKKMNTTVFEWHRIISLFVLSASFLLASYYTNQSDLLVQIVMQIVLTGLYILCLALGPIFSTSEKLALRDELTDRFQKFRNPPAIEENINTGNYPFEQTRWAPPKSIDISADPSDVLPNNTPIVLVDEMQRATQKSKANPAQATVIIPTLNEEAFLGDCLSSLAAHRGSIIEEVIVVDAGSTDNTKAIAEKHGVRFLPHSKSTIAAQRNAGAKLANTPLLAFLDADCTVTEEWSKSAKAEFDDESVVSAGAPPDIPEMGNTWVQRTWCFIKCSPRGTRQRVAWIASANVWVRKSTFDEIGGFNEAFETCEDADLGYRLSERGELVLNPDIRVQHHREPRTVSEFYQKEVWHGKNSFDGLWSGRLSLSELPSLITPIMFALSAMLFVAGLAAWPFYNVYPAVIGFAGLSLAPWAYTLRAIASKGQPSQCLHILAIYYIYFIARSDAFLRWCGRSVFR